MYLFSKLLDKKSDYFSLLLAAMPISFIAGNMIININTILLILLTFIFFGKNIIMIKFYLIDKLIFLFFLLVIITSFSSDYYFYTNKIFHATEPWKGYISTGIKSIFFLKYLLLYLVVRFLIEKKIIDLKFFFIICTFCSLFVSLDILIQFIFGKDIFGYGIIEGSRKLGGPFGDELIAGSYIQRFSLFAFFLLPVYFNHPKINKFNKFLLPLLFILFSITLILAGNRMHLLLFLFIFVLIFIFQKEVRKFFFHFIIIFTVIFSLLINFNNEIKINFKNFYMSISYIISTTLQKNDKEAREISHLKEFSTFYSTWSMHKYIGGGIKNFRYFCHVRPNAEKNSNSVCNMHPHNYYLEILTETGLLGFIIILIVFSITLYKTFFKKYIFASSLKENKIIIPFLFLFIAEIFPIKSTGSFFTTGNTTYIFLILSILLALTRNENLIENKS